MPKENKAFDFGPFRLEVRERRLTRDGHSVPLRGRVFDTLLALVSRHGSLVTKDELMAAVWPDSVVEESNINHNICVLRRALGEKATSQKYVETVPRQGYRFVAEVKELEVTRAVNLPDSRNTLQSTQAVRAKEPEDSFSLPDLQPSPEIPNGQQTALPAAHWRWLNQRAVFAVVAITAFLAAGYIGVQRAGFRGKSANSRTMLVVLPFENLTGDSTQAYIADGLNQEIISELARWNPKKLGIIARTSSEAYQEKRKSVSEIGRELAVDYIVEGSVRRSENRFRITILLIRAGDQAHLWSENYDRDIGDVMALQVEVTQIIIREIGTRIAVERAEVFRTACPAGLEARRNDKDFIPAGNCNTTKETIPCSC